MPHSGVYSRRGVGAKHLTSFPKLWSIGSSVDHNKQREQEQRQRWNNKLQQVHLKWNLLKELALTINRVTIEIEVPYLAGKVGIRTVLGITDITSPLPPFKSWQDND